MYTLNVHGLQTAGSISLNAEHVALTTVPASSGLSFASYALPAQAAASTTSAPASVPVSASGAESYGSPSNLKVYKQGQYVTFSWQNNCTGDYVTHELAYKLRTSSTWTYHKTSLTSLKVKLAEDGKYDWCVYTMIGQNVYSYVSDWGNSSFTFRGAPPKITFYSISKKLVSPRRTKVGLRWKTNEKSTYALYLDGKRVYKGKGWSVKRRYFTVKNGTHKYTLVAKDSSGNKSYKKGTFTCRNNVKAPAAPTALGIQLASYSRVTLNWTGMPHSSSITYEVRLKKGSSEKYYTTKSQSISIKLKEEGSWYWQVRAVNKVAGKRSAWVYGTSFQNKYGPFVVPNTPSRLRYQGTTLNGKPAVKFSWTAAPGARIGYNGYDLQIRAKGSSYETFSTWADTKPSLTLFLHKNAVYEWRVRTTTSGGSVSNWVKGTSFTNRYVSTDAVASRSSAAASSLKLDKELALSTSASARFSATEAACSSGCGLSATADTLQKKYGLLAVA